MSLIYTQKYSSKLPSLVRFDTNGKLGEYIGYPVKVRWKLCHWKGLSQSRAYPWINSTAHTMLYVVKYGDNFRPIIHLFHLSQCTGEFDN